MVCGTRGAGRAGTNPSMFSCHPGLWEAALETSPMPPAPFQGQSSGRQTPVLPVALKAPAQPPGPCVHTAPALAKPARLGLTWVPCRGYGPGCSPTPSQQLPPRTPIPSPQTELGSKTSVSCLVTRCAPTAWGGVRQGPDWSPDPPPSLVLSQTCHFSVALM